MVKIKQILEKMQGPSAGYQVFQLSRYIFLLLAALAVPKFGHLPGQPDWYETLALAGTAVSFFWVSGLFDAFVVRAQAVAPEKRRNVVLATFWMATLFALGSAAILVLTARSEFQLWCCYALFLFFDLGSFILPMSWLTEGRGKPLMYLGLATYGGYFLIVLHGIVFNTGLAQIFVVAAAWSGIRWLFLVYLFKPWQGLGDRDSWLKLLKLALPIAGVALISQGAWVLDGFLVKAYFPESFAAYRYGSKEFPLVLLIANALSMTHSGQIAAGIRGQKVLPFIEKLRSESLIIIHVGFFLTVLLVVFSSFIFNAVLGKEYSDAIQVFDICMLLAIPRLVFPQTLVRGYQHGFVLTLSATLELMMKVGLSFALMPLLGMPGLVLATVLGFAFEKSVLVWYCHKKLGHPLASYTPMTAWAGWSLVLLSVLLLKYLLFDPI